jgi:nucleoside-diphosphate-sugar epimerase
VNPTWLVTGGSGFLGRHLLDRLEREPVDLVAIGRRPLGRPRVRWIKADLADRDGLARVLDDVAPATIVHLAGRTPPADPAALDLANRLATLNLLDTLVHLGRPTRLVVAGSAAELGPVPVEDLPVAESYLAQPDTDYGRSKLPATEAVLAVPSPIAAVVARVFNPIGPGIPSSQAFGRFAAMIADAQVDTIPTGDLTARRDFIDVRDVAEALLSLGQSQATGLFHVGTGESRSVLEGLERLIALSGRQIQIVRDASPSRGPSDSRADISRISIETGWSPRIAFEQSLADLFAAASSGRG